MADLKDADCPLLKYLDDLVDDLRQLAVTALAGENVDAVHDARVATRRLKAALDLLDPVLSGRCKKQFAKVAKSVRKQLGPLRDLDVMLEHLDEIRSPRYAAAIAWLRERLKIARTKAIKSTEKDISPSKILARLGSWWGVRQEILDAREAIDALLAESVHLQLDSFAEQAQQLIATEKPAPHESNPAAADGGNDPHQLRIAAKSLRYTLEIARAHGSGLPANVTATFKRIQDALGLWHDYVVLTERILCETVDCDLALHHPDLQGQMLALSQLTLKKGQRNLKKMAALWRDRGAEISGRIRAAFPLTTPANAKTTNTPSAPSEPQKSAQP